MTFLWFLVGFLSIVAGMKLIRVMEAEDARIMYNNHKTGKLLVGDVVGAAILSFTGLLALFFAGLVYGIYFFTMNKAWLKKELF